MKPFVVKVKEIHINSMVVDADSPEEALRLVENGEGDSVELDLDETMPSDTWTVEPY